MDTLQITNRNDYQIIALQRGSGNPMNLQMIQELTQAIKDIQENEAIRGLILTSNSAIFSAGLDVVEMYGLDLDGLTAFWTAFKEMVILMVKFPKPFVVAITGHSPAGGCVMACCADYRVMVRNEQSRIGLNEIPVGITIPENIFHLYAFWLGQRSAYQYLMEGRLMLPEEAAAVGLIDELAPADEVLSRAEAKLQQYLRFDQAVWQTSKINLRQTLIAQIGNDYHHHARQTAERLFTPSARAFLEKVVMKLKMKS